MSGALVQLVSKGAQDVYITNNDGVSLFSLKYKRHTNFSQAPKLIKTITSSKDNIIKIDTFPEGTFCHFRRRPLSYPVF